MLAQARLKLKNAETSIAFLQEQHTKTLEGLHCEIHKLQKQNARLTFDLAMVASPGSANRSKCSGCQQLEDQLTTANDEILKLSSTLSSEKEGQALLKHQYREIEGKYLTDITSRDEIIQTLSSDLEGKSNTIALITQQYHQLRARLHQELENRSSPTNDDTTESTDAQISPYQYRGVKIAPNPPQGISRRTPATIQRRNFHRTTSSPVPYHVSSTTSIDGIEAPVPTPPISPKPTSYSSSPPAFRRASRPVRRSTASLSSRAPTPLQPVKPHKSGTIPSELSDILQGGSHEQMNMKQSHSVLPPIEQGSGMVGTPRKQHRHYLLSKAQGLSSAPVRPMRVLCYNTSNGDVQKPTKLEESELISEDSA